MTDVFEVLTDNLLVV